MMNPFDQIKGIDLTHQNFLPKYSRTALSSTTNMLLLLVEKEIIQDINKKSRNGLMKFEGNGSRVNLRKNLTKMLTPEDYKIHKDEYKEKFRILSRRESENKLRSLHKKKKPEGLKLTTFYKPKKETSKTLIKCLSSENVVKSRKNTVRFNLNDNEERYFSSNNLQSIISKKDSNTDLQFVMLNTPSVQKSKLNKFKIVDKRLQNYNPYMTKFDFNLRTPKVAYTQRPKLRPILKNA